MALEDKQGPDGNKFKVPAGKEPGRYPKMSQEERDEVYKSTKEALAGDLRTAPRNSLGNRVWNELASPALNYSLRKPAGALKGMPVSQAILNAMTQQNGSGGLGGRKPMEVMFYCLDYLQNAPENRFQTGTPEKGDTGISNIDKVDIKDEVEIYADDAGRWKLRVIKPDGANRMDGFLFPPAPEPTDVVTETPTDVVTETPTDVVTETPTDVVTETPTDVVTETPTDVVTETPTDVVTETPTDVVTETPTDVVTETPTDVVTETPTDVVTETPTDVVT
ncbi:MAG: hypothetical protein Q8P27_00555, partial [Candidatus Peregrinibacteria bacterium]|nr:hypothetical protein [Candidatus Peregrinibacteria bacterium]